MSFLIMQQVNHKRPREEGDDDEEEDDRRDNGDRYVFLVELAS